jgi:hypothetical protein
VTAADDVYAFGATVFDVVTSRPPFFRGNILWQLESVVPVSMNDDARSSGSPGEFVPPEWEEVVAACLAKRPGDRPKSMREVGERLDLLAPMPPGDVAQPSILPRANGEFSPQPQRKTEHIDIFPTSMPTAGMEPMTMAGVIDPPDFAEQDAAAEARREKEQKSRRTNRCRCKPRNRATLWRSPSILRRLLKLISRNRQPQSRCLGWRTSRTGDCPIRAPRRTRRLGPRH